MNYELTTKNSSLNFLKTVEKIQGRIEEKGLRIFALIHHHENAKKNGFELAPTTLIIFGNPNIGAPLMQLNQNIGIDLPMKLLVTEVNNEVTMTYNNPSYLKSRHDLPKESIPILDKVAEMLSKLTTL